MPRPTHRGIALLGLCVPLAAWPLLAGGPGHVAWLATLGLVTALGLLDVALTPGRRRVGVALEVPVVLCVGEAARIGVTARFPPGRVVGAAPEVEALLETGPQLQGAGSARARLGPDPGGGPGRVARWSVPLTAVRRGRVPIEALWLAWRGPLGLIERVARWERTETVAVGPDTRAARQALANLALGREPLPGLKVERHLGEGTEFHAMREYLPGLDPRTLDWRSTARHRRLICREHRAERNHPVVIAIDTGYRMSEPLVGLPRLDHAVRGGLALAWQALRTGDRVGLYAFAERPGAFAPPRPGRAAFLGLQELAAGLEYGTAEANFTLGLTWLAQRLKRRSLVVLLTDFLDTISAELMLENVQRLARRHLVLFVALRDAGLGASAATPPESREALCRAVVAAGLEREREQVLSRLRQRGVQVLDASPDEVDARLIDRYLEVKRRELVA